MGYGDILTLPESLQPIVESELQPGEQISWLGQPVPALMGRKQFGGVIFGFFWMAFCVPFYISMLGGVLYFPPSPVLGRYVMAAVVSVFMVPFFLIGLYLLTGPYWARRGAMRTAYVLTNRRAITFIGGWRGQVKVRSFEPEHIASLERDQRPDGSGDVVFTRDIHRDSEGHTQSTEVGFLAVADVKDVGDRVRAFVSSRSAATGES